MGSQWTEVVAWAGTREMTTKPLTLQQLCLKRLCENVEEILLDKQASEWLFYLVPYHRLLLFLAARRRQAKRSGLLESLEHLVDESWRSLDLSGLGFITNQCLSRCLPLLPRLHSLDVSGCDLVTGDVFTLLGQHCPLLQVLVCSRSGLRSLSSDHVRQLKRVLPSSLSSNPTFSLSRDKQAPPVPGEEEGDANANANEESALDTWESIEKRPPWTGKLIHLRQLVWIDIPSKLRDWIHLNAPKVNVILEPKLDPSPSPSPSPSSSSSWTGHHQVKRGGRARSGWEESTSPFSFLHGEEQLTSPPQCRLLLDAMSICCLDKTHPSHQQEQQEEEEEEGEEEGEGEGEGERRSGAFQGEADIPSILRPNGFATLMGKISSPSSSSSSFPFITLHSFQISRTATNIHLSLSLSLSLSDFLSWHIHLH